MPDLTPAQLHDVVTQTCSALGSADREAALVADQLVGANLAGHDSHGIGMLPLYVAHALTGELHVNEHVEVLNDTGPLVALDGRAGFGQVMGYEAMEIGIDRARQHGVSLVGLRNSFHIGRIGHWAEQCSAAGLVSLHLVNVAGHGAIVAPFGGASARLGTNPVCIGIPGRDGRPAVMLDMATSTIALGKARVALNKGERVPADTVVDANGNLSDDPSEVIGPDHGGALVAMGEHKGSGLAIMCELVGAALLGGFTMREQDGPGRIYNSMVTVVIDPEAVGGAEHLLAETEATVEWLRSGRTRVGVDEVLMPGEPEQRARIARAERIPVDDETWAQVQAAAAAAGVS
ncbi:MAG: malate/lactate/ureidoglycolate dehydrogenase [Acidimicrobiales bacterium]